MKRILRLAVAASLLSSGAAFAKGTAAKSDGTKLVLKVGPEDTEIFVDGQKKGTADKIKELALSPGAHIVNLKHKGDEHEDQVILKKGVKTTFEWKFEDDRPKEDNAPVDSPDGNGDKLPSTPAPSGGE